MLSWTLTVLAIALVSVAYIPGLSGIFLLDDYSNIVNQPTLHTDEISFSAIKKAVRENPTNMLGRPVAVVSFMLDYTFGGLNPERYLLSNLGIHLAAMLAGILMVYQIGRLTGIRYSYLAALCATTIWAAHPFNLTSVLYIVQRMTSLSALFTFLTLFVYAKFRTRTAPSIWATAGALALMGLLGVMAALSKENAALIPLFLIAVEWLARWTNQGKGNAQHQFVFWVCACIPSIALLTYLAWNIPQFAASYAFRPFSLSERLLTESRALWMYIGQIIYPRISAMSLYHDGTQISSGLFTPPITALAVFSLVGLICATYLLRKRTPWLCFGIMFFLVGHLLESTFIPLELIFEHRNYLPSLGLIAGATLQVADWSHRQPTHIQFAIRGFGVLICIIFLFQTYLRADLWGHPLERVAFELKTNGDSPRAQTDAATVLRQLCFSHDPGEQNQWCLEAIKHYDQAAELDPGNAGALIRIVEIRTYTGMPNADLDSISSKLNSATLTWVTYNVLYGFLVSEPTYKQLPAHWLANWAEAALKNPSMTQLARITIRSGYAQLLFNRMNRPDEAIEIMRAAADDAPERFDVQINMAKLYVATGQLENAWAQVQYLKSMPDAWAYNDEIERIFQ